MRRLQIFLSLLALVLCGVSVMVFWPAKPEPVYKGRKLSGWLLRARADPLWPENREALEAIGTNALPLYLEWLSYEPGPFIRAKLQMAKKGREWFNLHWRPEDRKALRAQGAAFAFSVLGQNGKDAISQLLMYATDPSAPTRRNSAMSSLAFMGDAAFPALASLTTNQNHEVRMLAMELITSRGFNEPGVKHLNLLLQHSDPAIRKDALKTLRWLVAITWQ